MLPNVSEAELAAILKGRRILSVDRRGKYLLIGFDRDLWLAIHRKMSGNLLLEPEGAPRALHTHLAVQLDDRTELRFVDTRKFGRVRLLQPDEVPGFLAAIGPEPLPDDFTLAKFRALLAGRKAQLKPLLLN